MKRLSLILLSTLVLTSAACAQQQQRQSQSAERDIVRFSEVHNPVIPAKVEIFGQTVDLDNADYYERYDRELTSLIYTHGNTLLIIKRANRYFPQIAPVLRANGMPEDLLYLACVESTMNPRAVSPAKAAGIWQFMPTTAREYGLEVSSEVDERYNIEKATRAACKYFKKSLEKYNGDWMAAMEAYNGGMTRISKQLAAQGADNGLDLYLTTETMRYPFRIMAMKTIMAYPAEYGFFLSTDQLYYPREVKIVEVSGPVADWAAWAKKQGIDYLTLRDENPWIRASKLTNKTGKTYKVRVPTKKSLSRKTCDKPLYNHNWAVK